MKTVNEIIEALRTSITAEYGVDALSEIGAVFYCDGGCRPKSRGYAGWGVHGYIYLPQIPKKGHGLKEDVATDFGYVNKSDGSPTSVTVLHYIDCFGTLIGNQATNNEAEIVALANAVEMAIGLDVKKVVFASDSRYTIDGAREWRKQWKLNGWRKRDKSEIPNVLHWIAMDPKLDLLIERGVDHTFQWVEGHSGLLGNDLADNLATRGVFANLKGLQCNFFGHIPAGEYWRSEISYHPLMSDARWMFLPTAPRTWNDYFVYHLSSGTAKRDVPDGKAHAEASHAVLLTKTANATLEDFFSCVTEQSAIPKDRICQVTLTNLFKRSVFNELTLSDLTGMEFISPSITPNHPIEPTATVTGLRTVQEINVLEVLDPPKISLRSLNEFSFLETILGEYVKKTPEVMQQDEGAYFHLTDITSMLFGVQKDAKGKEKVKILGENGDVHITVPYYYEGKELDLHLHYGVDLPRRRGMANIAESNPRVYLVSWQETALAFRYLTIIQTDDCLGIWSGTYSNLRLLPFKKT